MANQPSKTLTTAAIGLLLVALAPRIASAQSTDPRLLPWLGCWEPANGAESGDLLCVRPATQQSAVEVVRLAGSEIVSREVVFADGARHETQRSDCSGWEEGNFSKDGRRLFLSSEHACDTGTETGGGIMAIATPYEWLDIRVAGEGDDLMAWVQRYQLASAEKTEAAGFGDVLDNSWNARTARVVAAAPLDVDDVIEADAYVAHQAVEALLAERGDPLALDADGLLRMADAGVPSSTIDVAVAVSFPERFQVAQGNQPERAAIDQGDYDGRWGRAGYGRGYGYYNPYFYDPFYYGYGAYPYGGYFGYRGGYYGGYGYVPTVIVVDRQSESQPHGRFVAGRGYTRGGSSSGASRSYPSGATRSYPSSGGSRASGARGSSSGSSGRTAKPRGGRSSSQSSIGKSAPTTRAPAKSSSSGRTAKPRGGR